MKQRGGFALGLVVGLLVGLVLALGVALYITKAPVPFIDKVPQRTAEQDKAEIEKNRSWDPNALLGGKPARPMNAPAASAAASGPSSPFPPVAAPVATGARDPAAILSGAPVPGAVPAAPGTAKPAAAAAAPAADAFIFFVQAGAYTRAEDAEQQRARLAMLGQEAKVSEREQAGRVVYRVRVGPYPNRDDADRLQSSLQQQGVESQIVRVEKP
jgi:cell division protein FtsN